MAKFKLVKADCRDYLHTTKARYDFAFADPPFNIGHNYMEFKDRMSELDYIKFTREWVRLLWARMKPDGVMCLHGPDQVAKLYLDWERDDRLSKHAIAWIIWHYRFGQHGDSNWINSHCHCLVYAKNPSSYTWNPDDVLVASDRASVYSDSRIARSSRKGMRLPLTVWGVPSDGPFWGRVQGNSKERKAAHPNQLPEVYLERLIRAYSDPGDLCVDPFCGSGTTATVATALDRDCVSIDISQKAIESARERVKRGPVRVGVSRILSAGMDE